MKIKNFRINKKATAKQMACVLAGSLAVTTLTGCEDTVDRNNILKGTILEDTCVVTFDDGTKDIATAIDICSFLDVNRYHYYSVISGEYFSDENCTAYEIEGKIAHHHIITNKESITGYLTSDELTKAMQGELDNNDLISIVSRVIEPVTEETNTKAR